MGRDSSLPLIGVNTVLPKDHGGEIATGIEQIRSTEEEKGQQIANVQAFQKARNALAPAGETSHAHGTDSTDEETSVRPERSSPQASGVEGHGHGLAYLQNTARDRKNVFNALMEAVKTHSLRQISHALYDVGGEYRRNM